MSKNSKRKKNAPAKKRKGPSRPAKPPVPQQADAIRTRVAIEDGVVVMKYNKLVNWIAMSAADALYLSSVLRVRAETLILAAEESAR